MKVRKNSEKVVQHLRRRTRRERALERRENELERLIDLGAYFLEAGHELSNDIKMGVYGDDDTEAKGELDALGLRIENVDYKIGIARDDIKHLKRKLGIEEEK